MKKGENLRKKGQYYEQVAGAFLEKKGYRILQYNFRCPYAEIDVVAQKGNVLVFCEIKYRKGRVIERTLEAVDRKKQKRISAAALFYISKCFKQMEKYEYRFDVIGINDEEIVHIENAFDFGGM